MANSHAFIDQSAAFIARHGMLDGVRRLGVAVSGGADSMALLHVLCALSGQFGVELAVVHLNHGLRGKESDGDEAFVSERARRLGLPLEVRRAPAGEAPQTGIEEWGRIQRKVFFESLRAEGKCQRIATGHTQRDQAETVLFRMLRGTGPDGLGGIAPKTTEGIVRPLLWASREEVMAFLQDRGIPWVEDASNDSPEFARNRLRNQWLPALSAAWNPQLERVLANTAEICSEESVYMNRIADETLTSVFRYGPYGWEASAADLRNVPVAIQRRMLRSIAQRVCRTALDYEQLEKIRTIATSNSGRGRFGKGALLAERSGWRFRVAERADVDRRSSDVSVAIPGAGQFRVPGLKGFLEIEELPAGAKSMNGFNGLNSGYTEGWSFLRPTAPGMTLVLRRWHPGDAYQPLGSQSTRKLKEIFQRSGMPRWRRGDTLVLEKAGEVVWCSGIGASAGDAVRDESEAAMAVRFRENG